MMDSVYNTLHEFMAHAEGVTYILVVATLIGIAFFWRFLNGRDEDN
ncbi:MAG: hypothetical protein R6U50_13810 [Desulfobacterales bacterium]